MDISLEDFNALSAEQSRREVKIATLEMELQAQAARHQKATADLLRERDALWAENVRLREQNDMLRTDYENVRFENHWMRQYILLSVERVRDFFSHIRDITLLSAIKSFVMDMLPPNATPEQRLTRRHRQRDMIHPDTPPSRPRLLPLPFILSNHFLSLSAHLEHPKRCKVNDYS